MNEITEEKNLDCRRENYLEEFKRENNPDLFFKPNIDHPGRKIVELLKKEDLTYDQAYASLQYAYNLIKYESNFLKLS
nr:hypothetical protein [Melissococcus plutonius]